MKRRLLTLLLALCLTVGVTPALAAGEEAPQAEPLPGWATVVLADGSRYVICDPTYIGAPVGRCMDSYKNVSPDVIF